MSIAALSTIAEGWKEPKCLLMEEWRKKDPSALLVGMQTGTATVENSIKLKLKLPCHPAIELIGIYPKDTGVLFRRGTCTPMFIAALSKIAKVSKEPKRPSTNEWNG